MLSNNAEPPRSDASGAAKSSHPVVCLRLDRRGNCNVMPVGWRLDFGSLQQVIEPANAEPTVAVGLEQNAMFARGVGSAVIVRQKIDELAIDFRTEPNAISVGIALRLCTKRTELLRQS